MRCARSSRWAATALRILSGTVTSPTVAAQIQGLLKAYPKARWHRWEAAACNNSYTASVRAFGRPLATRYDLTPAKVVVTLNADLLAEGPGAPCATPASSPTAGGVRKASLQAQGMNRLYAVESFPTPHRHDRRSPGSSSRRPRWRPSPWRWPRRSARTAPVPRSPIPRPQTWLQAVAADLKANTGASLVVADEYASPALQVLVHAINQALGNAGKTVLYTEPVEVDPVDPVQSLGELVADMNAGKVGRAADARRRQPRPTRRRPTWRSPPASRRCGWRSITGCTRTRRPATASGT